MMLSNDYDGNLLDLKEPFDLRDGWLLWAGVGLLGALIAIALTGFALNIFSGENPQREVRYCLWSFVVKQFIFSVQVSIIIFFKFLQLFNMLPGCLVFFWIGMCSFVINQTLSYLVGQLAEPLRKLDGFFFAICYDKE